ncbi:MAG: acyltransferase [Candidatus Heimdallarchaeota archaeon]|nr:acyltransferase [Candidatus Heimdallarchaeota archaeon]
MIVKCGLIQLATAPFDADTSLEDIKEANFVKHETMIRKAGEMGVQIVCLQELFMAPYFAAEQKTKWYGLTENIPGPTTERFALLAKELNMVLILPMFERSLKGIYYNTAAVIDADGTYLGKYRKNHIPHALPGFWEKFYFRPGNLGYPAFETKYAKIGVYICYDRHFPEAARALALNGAEIIFNPSATIAGFREHLWKIEQPAHAIANGVFIAPINRVGEEQPWKTGNFFGTSYFVDPFGKIIVEGTRDQDELVVADLDLDEVTSARDTWQFFRDRRPETYEMLVKL